MSCQHCENADYGEVIRIQDIGAYHVCWACLPVVLEMVDAANPPQHMFAVKITKVGTVVQRQLFSSVDDAQAFIQKYTQELLLDERNKTTIQVAMSTYDTDVFNDVMQASWLGDMSRLALLADFNRLKAISETTTWQSWWSAPGGRSYWKTQIVWRGHNQSHNMGPIVSFKSYDETSAGLLEQIADYIRAKQLEGVPFIEYFELSSGFDIGQQGFFAFPDREPAKVTQSMLSPWYNDVDEFKRAINSWYSLESVPTWKAKLELLEHMWTHIDKKRSIIKRLKIEAANDDEPEPSSPRKRTCD
jgi:hypothetical protein